MRRFYNIIRRRGLCIGFENHWGTCVNSVEARCPVHANIWLRIVLHFAFDEALRPSIADDPRYTANPCTNPTVFFSRKKHGSVKSCTVPFPSQVGGSRAFLALDISTYGIFTLDQALPHVGLHTRHAG